MLDIFIEAVKGFLKWSAIKRREEEIFKINNISF